MSAPAVAERLQDIPPRKSRWFSGDVPPAVIWVNLLLPAEISYRMLMIAEVKSRIVWFIRALLTTGGADQRLVVFGYQLSQCDKRHGDLRHASLFSLSMGCITGWNAILPIVIWGGKFLMLQKKRAKCYVWLPMNYGITGWKVCVWRWHRAGVTGNV